MYCYGVVFPIEILYDISAVNLYIDAVSRNFLTLNKYYRGFYPRKDPGAC